MAKLSKAKLALFGYRVIAPMAKLGKPARKNTEYQRAIDQLGLMQMEASEFFQFSDRTSRRYASLKQLPMPMALAMALMIKFKITPDRARQIVDDWRKVKTQKKPQTFLSGAKSGRNANS